MPLKTIYDKQDEIPEAHRELFTERGGKWELTGVEGIRSQGDVDRLNEALRKERADHKAAKDKLAVYGDLDPEKVREQLSEVEELRIRAEKGSISDEKLEELVTARRSRKLGPVERERDQLKGELGKRESRIGELEGTIRKGTIERALREATVTAKTVPEAFEDIALLGERVFDVTEDGQVVVKDQVGFTPGLRPSEWLTEVQTKRPHWWPPSESGGAGGSKGGGGSAGPNPWSADQWNLTEQGKFLRQNGVEKAERAAKAAGSYIGAFEPPKKSAA